MVQKYVEFHIICDNCGLNGATESDKPFGTGNCLTETSAIKARKLAKLNGWIYRKDKNIDLCPNCVKLQKIQKILEIKNK